MANYICRPCAASLRHVRQFSVKAARQASLQVPRSADNPELDKVFLTLRDKHFIPASLNKAQRQLIFDPKRQSELENSPFSIQVGDEEIELEHIQPYQGVPARRPLVVEALRLMKKGDMSHVPKLFEALIDAGGKPDSPLIEKTIRSATQARCFHIVLQCLMRPDSTGFSFKRPGILKEVLKSLHLIAQRDNWDMTGLDKATRYANSIAHMFDNEAHIGQIDPRQDPEVLGMYLQLAAIQAHKHNGQDLDKYLRRTTERLGHYQPVTASSQQTSELYNEFMSRFPLWHGLSVAKMVTQVQETEDVARVLGQANRMEEIVKTVESQGPHQEGSYGHRVLDSWAKRIRA